MILFQRDMTAIFNRHLFLYFSCFQSFPIDYFNLPYNENSDPPLFIHRLLGTWGDFLSTILDSITFINQLTNLFNAIPPSILRCIVSNVHYHLHLVAIWQLPNHGLCHTFQLYPIEVIVFHNYIRPYACKCNKIK